MKKTISIILLIAVIFGLVFFVSKIKDRKNNTVTFGVISDVHEDLQKDAGYRLQTFLDAAGQQKPDFIIQLGDLCHSTGVDKILKVWNNYEGEKYNVFGNHDMDNATKEEMTKRYNMPAGHYYFDKNGVRFIILDCAYTRKDGVLVDYNKGNYFVKKEDRDLINDEQLEWMRAIVKDTDFPCVVFSHQAFDKIGGSVPNRQQFRDIVKELNKDKKRIIACICGHHHIDAHSKIDDVDYLQINSASYLWVDGEKKYSNGNMAEYEDPVYAFITIDLNKRELIVDGIQSKFKEPAPVESDFGDKFQYINAGIENRTIKF